MQGLSQLTEPVRVEGKHEPSVETFLALYPLLGDVKRTLGCVTEVQEKIVQKA